MKQRLALITAGYFVVIGIILAAVLPFAVDVLHRATLLQKELGPAQVNAQGLEAAAVDQETGERGYVITGDPAYLEPWNSGRRDADRALAALAGLSLSRDERDALGRAKQALTDWQQKAANPEIAATRHGELARARATVGSGQGKYYFDAFRRAQGRFFTLVQRRLDEQRRALHRNAGFAIVALAVASAAGAASALLLRAWSHGDTKREEREVHEQLTLAELHRMIASLASSRSGREVAQAAVRDVAPLVDAAIVRMWTVVSGERLELVGEYVDPDFAPTELTALSLADKSPASDALHSAQALFFSSLEELTEQYPGWAPLWQRQGAQAFAVLPLRTDEDEFGVLLAWYRDAQVFDDRRRALLMLVADNVGTAYERARIREREHDAALKLQESLLGPPTFLEGAGHTLRYLPAEPGFEVGGDWHNAQRLPDGRIVVAIGDVVGRGIDAATTMGQLRSCVSACAPRCSSPADLLECVDDFARALPGAQGTTVALVYVDPEAEQIEYLCAGHPPPIAVDPDGRPRLLDNALSWPLGIDHERPPGLGATVPFPAGSLLLLYTDGLIERRRTSLDVGIDRLMRSAAEHGLLALDALCDAVLADAFADARREDDVALLALRTPVMSQRLFLMKEPALPTSMQRVRAGLREWLPTVSLSPTDEAAILIAIGEACTNAVEHANADSRRAFFRVEARVTDDDIVFVVTDNGAWKDNPDRAARGNGIAIMRELMHDVTIETRAAGTAVTLRFATRERDERVVHA